MTICLPIKLKMAGKEPKIEQDLAESAFNALIDETVKLYRRLNIVADEVHHQGEMSGGLRGILRGLKKEGPQTVPHMARIRAVSRQHIQILVNQLAEQGFVELTANPESKRSPLVSLTTRGKNAVEEMNQRESRLLSKSDVGISEDRMRETAESLRTVREFFEGDVWQQKLKAQK